MPVSRKTLTVAETFFQPEIKLKIDVKTTSTVTLLETLNANKVSINQSCGGNGTCGTCRVEIISGSDALRAPSDYEIEASQELQVLPQQRLCCQAEFNPESSENQLTIKIVNEVI